jgi:hypothetical protein
VQTEPRLSHRGTAEPSEGTTETSSEPTRPRQTARRSRPFPGTTTYFWSLLTTGPQNVQMEPRLSHQGTDTASEDNTETNSEPTRPRQTARRSRPFHCTNPP